VYTIAYRVHTHIPNGHRRGDPRAEVGEDVRVGVGVRVGAVKCQLNRACDRSGNWSGPG